MNQSNGKTSNEKCVQKPSRFRSILAQFVAASVKNFLLFDLGLCISLPSIVVPALTGILNEHNRDEFLTITAEQATWIGSIGYLVQPFGSLFSSILTDPLGRKNSMILVNIPYAIGWVVLYQATDVWHIFTGFVMLGLAVGLMESAIVTYLGEICEPSVRGVLIGYTFVCGTIGMFAIYLLNTLMPWRTVALVSLSVPIITAIAICFIPETPQWLLSKNRVDEAEKSLRWLRGWTSREVVAEEFNRLKEHSEISKSCYLCAKQNMKCSHPLPTLREKFAELKRKQTLKPFAIIAALFVIAQFTGVWSMRPFIVQIFKAYDSPISPDKAAAIMSFTDNLSNVAFICLVRFTGKRRLYLASAFGVFLSSLVISCYGFRYLPSGYISFRQLDEPFHLENNNFAYIPVIGIFLWSFFSFCGFNSLPWMFLSELFPFKSRGVATGLAAALNYVLGFISRKTYYNLETYLSLPGATLLFCTICGCGLILMYFILPETENRTLEDIEIHFSDNSKSLTDRKIPKSTQSSNNSKQENVERAKNGSNYQNGSKPEKISRNGNGKFEDGFVNKGFEMDSRKT